MKIIKYLFTVIIKESVILLVNPPYYFTNMKRTGGFLDAVLKILFYGLISAWLHKARAIEIYNASIVKLFIPGQEFILNISLISIIVSLFILLFIGSALVLIISKLCKGNIKFVLSLKISASILIVSPFIIFIYSVSIARTTAIILNLLAFLYGVWIFYNAMTLTLEGNKKRVIIFSIIFAALFITVHTASSLSGPVVPLKKEDGKMTKEQFLQLYEKMKEKKKEGN